MEAGLPAPPACSISSAPAFGIISDGFDNSYGHPHPLTLAALSERHIAVFRTDQQGLTTVISDGKHVQIQSASPH